MVNTAICILTNMFRVYLIYRYIKIFAGEDREQGAFAHNGKCVFGISRAEFLRRMLFVIFFLVNTSCYLVFHSAWMNFTTNLVGISLLAAMYHKSWKTISFVACSIYCINIACDSIVVLSFIKYEYGKEFNQFYEILTIFLFLVCELMTEKIVNGRKGVHMGESLPFVMTIVPISAIIIVGLLMYIDYVEKGLVIVCIGFLIINFLVLYLYNMMLKSFSHKYENEMLKQTVQSYANQVQAIQQSEEKVNLLKHDIKHHLNELKLMAIKGEFLAIEEYIDSMAEFMQNPNEIVSSGNTEVDSILNYMLQKTNQVLWDVQVKVHLPEKICHTFDVNMVLGNLLENAIEAAQQTEEKMLHAVVEFQKGILKIEIVNSFSGEYTLKTTKNQGHHGFGLQSVRKAVEKHQGVMEVWAEGEQFHVKIMMYLPEENV